jgi:hypothetical protein
MRPLTDFNLGPIMLNLMKTAQITRRSLAILALALIAGCREGDNPLGPDAKYLNLAVLSGNDQFGGANAQVFDPLRVMVSFQLDGLPANRAVVHWQVISGTGATVDPVESRTDATGITSTKLLLGGVGDYEIEAKVIGSTVRTVRFTAHAVVSPLIETIQPQQAKPGDTLTIRGRNFSTIVNENSVLFDGVQGTVVSATATEMKAVVPECIPARAANVIAAIGAVGSPAAKVQITSNLTNLLELAPGQVVTLPRTAARSCVQLPAQSGALYLVVTQNLARSFSEFMPFELVGLAQQAPPASARTALPLARPVMPNQGMTGVALEFEAKLRARESTFDPKLALVNQPQERAAAFNRLDPQVGDRRRFSVQNKDGAYVLLDAEAKAISQHAIVYQEIATPNGFTPNDFINFVKLVEDPIYDTNVKVFGESSDVDADGRMIIVLTSVVNRMTEASDAGFIAGFFDACDLMARLACPSSNRGEIFYAVLPDPEGVYGKKHPASEILRRIPPAIAHEFQHMIHWNQRALRLRTTTEEESWLKEALAHMAEDTVAGVFLERGDLEHASDFLIANYIRANYFLTSPSNTSLLYLNEGTLAERGAGWLLLRYLLGHVQGPLLRDLTQNTRTGIATLEAASGKSWETLLSEWSVALWADNAPELGDARVERRYTFPNMNLRDALGTSQSAFNNTFGLRPAQHGFVDFSTTGSLPGSSQGYVLLSAGASPQPLIVNLTGARGAMLPSNARAQISVLRVR